jgi:hypothetical protein
VPSAILISPVRSFGSFARSGLTCARIEHLRTS